MLAVRRAIAASQLLLQRKAPSANAFQVARSFAAQPWREKDSPEPKPARKHAALKDDKHRRHGDGEKRENIRSAARRSSPDSAASHHNKKSADGAKGRKEGGRGKGVEWADLLDGEEVKKGEKTVKRAKEEKGKEFLADVFSHEEEGEEGDWEEVHGDENDDDDDDEETPEQVITKHAQRMSAVRTVFDMYRYAVTTFSKADLSYGHSTLNPWEDAAFLIMHELALPIKDPISHWGGASLLDEEKEHLFSLIDRRVKEMKPTPYLIQACYFQDEYFYVDERVLVPRSFLGEILCNKDLVHSAKKAAAAAAATKPAAHVMQELNYEDYMGEVVDEAKATAPTSSNTSWSVRSLRKEANDPLLDIDTIHNVLDLCTGSGCLAILASRIFSRAKRIHAADISKDALEVAKINVENKGLDEQIKLFQGDLFQALVDKRKGEPIGTKYDLILCNPPYVTTEDMRHLPDEYAHEPALALEAGKDGLRIIRKLLQEADSYLSDRGVLLVEVGQCKPALVKAYPALFAAPEVRWISTAMAQDEVVYIPKTALALV